MIRAVCVYCDAEIQVVPGDDGDLGVPLCPDCMDPLRDTPDGQAEMAVLAARYAAAALGITPSAL